MKIKQAHKYGAKPVTSNGQKFSSKLEYAVYQALVALQTAGEIKSIKLQEKVYLTEARILIKPDFTVTRPDDSIYYVEAKGKELATWNIKKRLWQFYGPAKLEVWKTKGSRLVIAEVITPKETHDRI